jgi:LytS/YehU family sensor histidine kinase
MNAEVATLHISIDAVRNGAAVEIHLRDDGIGVQSTASTDSGGRGIGNVRSRLAHLYGKNYAFSVGQLTPRGTDVCVTLPFHS